MTEYLQSLGYRCTQGKSIPDEDGDLVPMFYIFDKHNKEVAYSTSESGAWQALVDILRYRNQLPED